MFLPRHFGSKGSILSGKRDWRHLLNLACLELPGEVKRKKIESSTTISSMLNLLSFLMWTSQYPAYRKLHRLIKSGVLLQSALFLKSSPSLLFTFYATFLPVKGPKLTHMAERLFRDQRWVRTLLSFLLRIVPKSIDFFINSTVKRERGEDYKHHREEVGITVQATNLNRGHWRLRSQMSLRPCVGNCLSRAGWGLPALSPQQAGHL